MCAADRSIPRQLQPHHARRWQELLSEQRGVVSTEQLTTFGVGPSAVKSHLSACRWQRVVPRIYATFTGSLPREALLSAGLLYGGSYAVLSHRTAAEQWGLLPTDEGTVHVTVPYGCSAVSQPPRVVVHRSRALRHIVAPTSPPTTSRADTVLDVAVLEPTARDAMRVLTALITTGRIGPWEVRRRLEQRPPRRYRRALCDAVARVLTGVESPLEELYAVDVEFNHGIPSAMRQTPVIVDGQTLLEDATYDHLGVPLTVRLDGRWHLEPDVAARDRRRDNAAELAGRSRLVFGWRELSEDPCRAAREVFAVLTRHGWTGTERRCARCS